MTQFLPFTRPAIDEETIAAVSEVLRSGWITSGPRMKDFEAALSAHCGNRVAKSFNSGTATLEMALRLAGIGPGDEVITTPLTWVATANVILKVGARPVFADVDPVTRNIDPAAIEAALTPRTRALLPVDLAGLPADRDRIYAIAKAHHLRVIEDAAQSFGSSWRGKPIGSFGDFVSFSFHANKNITTGEGGALVLPPDVDPARCERLRLQGVQRFPGGAQEVIEAGDKWNLTDIAAAIGLGQLKRTAEFTGRRRTLARIYFERLAQPDCTRLGLVLPVADFEQSNWHMFQVLLPEGCNRADFMAALQERGIGTQVHYPALHLFQLYRQMGWREGDFPQAERIGRTTITLPLFPAMADADVDRVCRALAQVLK